jgi:hypothetical protein
MENCSTSWSSDDDDVSTTSSLDKMNGDAPSDANDDATPCTLVDDGSCSGYESDASTSSPSPHCFMSQGDTKVQNANVVYYVDSCHGTAQIIRTKVQKQSPEQLNSRT